MKKYKLISFVILCMVLLNTTVYGTTINIVNSNSENSILNDDIKFTKKIVNYDKETQEIEIELYIENIKKNLNNKEDIEVAVVLDNSSSMSQIENNGTRKNITYNATNKFIDLIYNNIKKLKIELMRFSNNTVILTPFTDSKNEAMEALIKYKNTICNGDTNTQGALKLAQGEFSNECKNKVIVLLTDGYPNNAEETKKQLERLKDEGIYVLSLIVCKEADIPTIQQIFGTEEEPTVGNVYYIQDSSQIDEMFNKYIYKQILNYMEHPIINISIEDVFPEKLLRYFDIEYKNFPTDGTTTGIIDNSFTWSIDEIKGEESAKFTYKVKIKKDVDITKLIGTELKTNEKVIINYEDKDGNKKKEIFDKNPAISIEQEEIDKEPNINKEQEKIDNENDNITENKSDDSANNEKEQTKVDTTKNEEEYVIVNMTPKDEDSTKNQIPKKTTISKKNNKSVERLPQTGINNNILIVIGASILLTIGFGVKLKLINKKIK